MGEMHCGIMQSSNSHLLSFLASGVGEFLLSCLQCTIYGVVQVFIARLLFMFPSVPVLRDFGKEKHIL